MGLPLAGTPNTRSTKPPVRPTGSKQRLAAARDQRTSVAPPPAPPPQQAATVTPPRSAVTYSRQTLDYAPPTPPQQQQASVAQPQVYGPGHVRGVRPGQSGSNYSHPGVRYRYDNEGGFVQSRRFANPLAAPTLLGSNTAPAIAANAAGTSYTDYGVDYSNSIPEAATPTTPVQAPQQRYAYGPGGGRFLVTNANGTAPTAPQPALVTQPATNSQFATTSRGLAASNTPAQTTTPSQPANTNNQGPVGIVNPNPRPAEGPNNPTGPDGSGGPTPYSDPQGVDQKSWNDSLNNGQNWGLTPEAIKALWGNGYYIAGDGDIEQIDKNRVTELNNLGYGIDNYEGAAFHAVGSLSKGELGPAGDILRQSKKTAEETAKKKADEETAARNKQLDESYIPVPTMSQEEIDKLIEADRVASAAAQGRTLRAAMERASRAGISPEAATGMQSAVSQTYGTAQLQQENQKRLTFALQNLDAQRQDAANKYAIAMAKWSRANTVEDRDTAITEARAAQQAQFTFQRQMQAIQDSISPSDILGAVAGGVTGIGGMLLGNLIGGGRGAARGGIRGGLAQGYGIGPSGGGSYLIDPNNQSWLYGR